LSLAREPATDKEGRCSCIIPGKLRTKIQIPFHDKRLGLFVLGPAVTFLLCLYSPKISQADELAAAKVYDSLRGTASLEAFFRAFPKGGDLHNHTAGGIHPEKWIEIAIKHNFCFDERVPVLEENLAPTCPAGTVPAGTLRNGGPAYDKFVGAMSMRDSEGHSKGHDYFFQQAFEHFRADRQYTPGLVLGDVLETVVRHADEQNMTYLELQLIPLNFFSDSSSLAALLPTGGSLAEWLDTLDKSPLLPELVEKSRRMYRGCESELLERCPREAAAIRRRYLITVGRGIPPQRFFSELAMVAELVRAEPLVVGMNLAGAEDDAVSIRDFRLQMRMIDFILSRKPWMRVTLHAGEMTPQILGAAPGTVPEALTYHIAESVRNGHAERIGHGSDLRYERERADLLQAMHQRGVLVEICPTSEELIQGLKPDENPFADYREAGVPVSLNTDDEGILGSDLSHEFLRAARDYRLGYGELKELARNSIEYSFLPGHSLFRTREFKAWVPACSAAVRGENLAWATYLERLGTDCRAYLGHNPKAEAQVRLEYQFQQFESSTSLRRFHVPTNSSDRK
jgi:adenosine deaminase